ncbi:MAG: DUF1917 domain-containing protein [Firmicutes bacterium]|nr:DUF1917 domain-containing protein [Bacillota bacterium]
MKGVDSGNILCAKTTSATKVTKGCYATMIYTKNYQDKEDIARVLEYLTSVGLKDKKTIYYKSDEQTRLGKKDSLYSSDDF